MSDVSQSAVFRVGFRRQFIRRIEYDRLVRKQTGLRPWQAAEWDALTVLQPGWEAGNTPLARNAPCLAVIREHRQERAHRAGEPGNQFQSSPDTGVDFHFG